MKRTDWKVTEYSVHPASLKCDKYYWNFFDIENFRLTMKLAESCSDFVASKDAKELGFMEE